jgi:hypothetical protein
MVVLDMVLQILVVVAVAVLVLLVVPHLKMLLEMVVMEVLHFHLGVQQQVRVKILVALVTMQEVAVVLLVGRQRKVQADMAVVRLALEKIIQQEHQQMV